ncbi:anaerobic ribonucleoside-triphosphate reductase activating protein [Desulfonema ishimotonii]|uniref:Anaerobic ribonucleoside-triphosphate reductase activating protein n=1 Tax=Desulfonema ishimotonii TaxID=45657 RepID=A0A401G3C8_9BACT|nr:anaerobic ribonucleoside-triphosphate reductase activating protein [Desulfonema ishimotonii]GBC63681.1 anaerobic ribonucleoside-triphosphate reductase activating protein [Desulfonema ishimotonii]
MIFGGLQKNSFIDYPGKISCVLFTSGCNFDCPYCHNPDLVRGCRDCPRFLGEKTVYDFLEQRRGCLDGVVISGGEPTLHDDLIGLCERVKKMGYPVKLDTNGSRPEVVRELIDRELVDYLAMDIKTDPMKYSPLIRKKGDPASIFSSIRLIMNSGIPYEFKTTCVRPLVDEQIIENICHLIQGARLYALQQFHEADVLHPEFFDRDDCLLSHDALTGFKAIADEWVETCIVR